MNNIYLSKTTNFSFDKSKGEVPFQLSEDFVDNWVKNFGLKKTQTKDFTTEIESQRYRVHLFYSLRGWNAALRLLPSEILSFEALNINSNDILSLCKGTGLVLFCGPTGAGKSTTMNTTIDSLLNSDDLGVTITIEDPIEYLHGKDEIFQREVGTHVESFSKGLVDAMRVKPTTIVIGEIRDAETALEAVRAGLNGHRVLATIHASSAKEAISRLWAFLDDQGDELLIQSLQGVVAQHLINISNKKKYCLYETLEINSKTKNLLNQVLKGDAELVQLNQIAYEQERMWLEEKKQVLIKKGINPSLFDCIRI